MLLESATMHRLTLAGLVALACAGSPPVSPQPDPVPAPPLATESAAAASTGAPEGGEPADAALDVQSPDAGAALAGGDAGADAAPRVCAEAADYVPYVVNLGPPDNSAAMGPYQRSPSDEGRPIRATLSAFTAPKDLDAFNFAAYLPYYVAGAYQEAIATRPGLRGSVRVRLVLDANGKATTVEIKAPGFPAAFVDEVRERASTTYAICSPLPAPAIVSATITLEPRQIRRPGRR